MANTLSFLRSVCQNSNNENNIFIVLVSLVLTTIPLNYFYNSCSIIVLCLYSIYTFVKNREFRFYKPLIPLVLLFGLMVMSLLWTLNFNKTLNGIGKEASLLVIPLAFSVSKVTYRHARRIIGNYAFCMVLVSVFMLCRALIRYIGTGNPEVFYYHELSTIDVNAIYCSALMSIAFFYYISSHGNVVWKRIALFILFIIIMLLSSKTVIIIDILLCAGYYILNPKMSVKAKAGVFCFGAALLFLLAGYGKIKDRLVSEYKPNVESQLTHEQAKAADTTYQVTLYNAVYQEKFGQNGYFNGTSFRVYQARIFTEMLRDDNKYLLGYGFNASQGKIMQKGSEHDVFWGNNVRIGYQNMNFHNQYIQVFAELGAIGFIILIYLLIFNLKMAIKNKYFVHIAFAILMLALFLTESFIWRQRGVVLFTVLYCLLNRIASKEKETL